jgi:transketolase
VTRSLINSIRRDVVEAGYHCGESAHFGGGLSIVDLLAVLYEKHLRFDKNDPLWPERDVFILSKGHGVLGYFATLKNIGLISSDCFRTFQKNGSDLIAHPVLNLPLGIESSNGSLGQGLSFGCGIALAAKKKLMHRRIYIMLGDGECNEGAVWEAAMFAAQYELDNLIAIIDVNGFQNDGPTAAVSNKADMAAKWAAFGWNTIEIDGHSTEQIRNAYTYAENTTGKPIAIIANTVKGKGVSFMENNNEWHHNRLTEKNYLIAIDELENSSD